MMPLKPAELAWRELLLIIIVGLVIGGAFGQLVKAITPTPVSDIAKEKQRPSVRTRALTEGNG